MSSFNLPIISSFSLFNDASSYFFLSSTYSYAIFIYNNFSLLPPFVFLLIFFIIFISQFQQSRWWLLNASAAATLRNGKKSKRTKVHLKIMTSKTTYSLYCSASAKPPSSTHTHTNTHLWANKNYKKSEREHKNKWKFIYKLVIFI